MISSNTVCLTPFIAEVITVLESSFWSLSTPIDFLFVSSAAAKIELQICPPQAKITSVPPLYHPVALVLISGDSLNVPV